MPKQNIINTNFTSGEVSPLVRGRVDAQKYGNGLETCENFIVRPQGPIWRRSGTEMIKPTKFPTQKSILVPFEYSDLSGYVLEFGVGYIHFYKNGMPLWETTTTEIEEFNVSSNALNQLTQLQPVNDPQDLPGWGPLSNIGAGSNNGTITLSNNGSNLVRITTSVPHTLRTGTKVYIYSTEIASISTLQHTITRINNYTVDLQGSTYSTPAGGGAYTVMLTHGLLAGDRMYVSGAAEYDKLTEKSHLVHSVETYSAFTLNIPYENDGTPTKEEGHTIPIEIDTPYGYMRKKSIGAIGSSGSLVNVLLENHGFSTGDVVNIYLTYTSADGQWTITKVDDNNFTLNSSIWKANSLVGYARKYVGESHLEELRFVQSADVLYIMHPDLPVYKLTRLTNDGDRNDWLFAEVDFKDGPYLPLNSLAPEWDETTPANGSRFADVYFELSDYLHTATVRSAVAFAAGTPSADVGKYIEYREGDQWRLAKVYTGFVGGATSGTVQIIDNVLLHLDETVKFTGTKRIKTPLGTTKSVVYDAGSPNLTPTIPGAAKQSKIDPNNYIESDKSATHSAGTGDLLSTLSNTFSQSDVGKYVRYFDTGNPGGTAGQALSGTNQVPLWAQIVKIAKGFPGTKCLHDIPLVMASNNATGNFQITNHSRTAKLKAYKNLAQFAAFKPSDVGRLFRIGWGGRWVWGKIKTYHLSSFVDVELYEDVPRDPHNAANLAGATNGALTSSSTTGRSYDWRMGAWSETTGYPSCGVFHEQRLWFGRTDTEPQTIWGSVSGDFENFSPTELDSAVLEDNAIGFTIASTKANPIKWMVSGPAITVGTTGGEWQVKSSSVSSEPITPLNIVVVPHTSHGSHSKVQPIRLGNSILFADRPGNRVRELIYDFSVDALISRDLTYLSEHMLRENSGAVYSAYQQEPNNICWYVLGDGTLAAVTINKDQEVVAWHHHTVSGGTIESIAVAPSTDSSRDDLYMVVLRGSNRYVEILKPDFYPVNASTRTGMRYLDSSVTVPVFNGALVAGLHHLNTKVVTVAVNGTVLANTYTVSSGTITIPTQTNAELVVGLPYTSTAKSLPPEGGSAFGVSQGKIKKLAKYNVRLLNSLALDYGFNANSQALNSLTNLHENGTSTDFYTGTKELIPNNPYDAESQWTLSTSKPYPLNVLSVTLTVETGE